MTDRINKLNLVDKEEIENSMRTAENVKSILYSLYGEKERPKYYIHTFGCQQNEADSENLAGFAEMMGYVKCDSPSEALLILVNTCAVREHAELKALSYIGEYGRLKSNNPDIIIGVGGCMATLEHRAEKIKKSYPYVNFTFDTGSLHLIPELVFTALGKKGRTFKSCGGDFKIPEGIPAVRNDNNKVWLSIMYGCNNFCSYCIVPYTRGRERSRRMSDIVEEAAFLISKGAKDITLLGQNVNSYGNDTGDGSIAELIHEICLIPGDFRLRFMTSHPKDASDELIYSFKREPKLVKHFHLPVQSGSNKILERMNRKYTREDYLRIINKLKTACPDISITSDIIVGFPGETEEDFEATLDIVEKTEYDMIFSFIYSPRPGTPAAKLEDTIDVSVSTERLKRLNELQNQISLKRNSRFVGRTLSVFVEEISHTDSNMLTGRGDPVRPIHFPGGHDYIGTIQNIKIDKFDTFALYGEIVP